MNRPWMPLYITDYLADTVHLTTVEHGAYLLLIMAYWKEGKLPQDDTKLARICRMAPAQWAEIRDVIAEMFQDGWRHSRIDQEIAKVTDVSEKRKFARSQVGKRTTGVGTQAPAPATSDAGETRQVSGHLSTHSHSDSHSHSHPEKTAIAVDGADRVSAERLAEISEPDAPEDPKPAKGKRRHDPAEYLVDEPDGCRITHAQAAKWQEAFPHINVAGELTGAAGWIIPKFGEGWFHQLRSWLAKKDREAKAAAEGRKAEAEAKVDAAGKPVRSRFQW